MFGLSERQRTLALAAGAAALIAVGFWQPGPDENLCADQARAWLAGRLDLPAARHDVATVAGRHFVPFPPFPSLLLLPFVAVGIPDPIAARTVAGALALAAALALIRTFRRLEVEPAMGRWLAAGAVFGTGLWLCVLQSNGVWFLAHAAAFAGLALAVDEVFGRARGGWVGLWLGLAFLSRHLAVYALIFAAIGLWERNAARGRRTPALHALAGMAVFGLFLGAYLAFNHVRFGSPFETGYSAIALEEHLRARVEAHGLFSLAYVPFNLTHMFLEGPHFVFDGPRALHPAGLGPMGTAITFASPFLFLAFAARGGGRLQWAAWAAVALCLGHLLLYYNNGWVQVQTQRFALDFIPVLLPLVALGARRVPAVLWKSLIAWSIGWNVIAFVLLPNAARWFVRL